jgi:hypothetical protein
MYDLFQVRVLTHQQKQVDAILIINLIISKDEKKKKKKPYKIIFF